MKNQIQTSKFLIRSKSCGLFLSDCSCDFAVIAVTCKPERAASMEADQMREMAARLNREYPSFDWRVVERSSWTTAPTVPVFLRQQAA